MAINNYKDNKSSYTIKVDVMNTHNEIIRNVWQKEMPEYFPELNIDYPKKIYLDKEITETAKKFALSKGYTKEKVDDAICEWKSGELWYDAVESYWCTRKYNYKQNKYDSPKEIIEELKYDFPMVFTMESNILHNNNTFKEGPPPDWYHKVNKYSIDTGFDELNAITKGIKSGDIILVSSRPFMGEYDFMLNMASNIAMNGKKVGIFVMKSSKQLAIQHIICSIAELNGDIFKKRTKLTQKEQTKLFSTINMICTTNIIILDSRDITPYNDFEHIVKSVIMENALDIIFMDKVDRHYDYDDCLDDTNQFLKNISSKIRKVSLEFKIPMIIGYDLPRSIESRREKRPRLTDLSTFIPLRDIANIIILIYRQSYYRKYNDSAGVTEFIIEKNRENELDTILLHYNMDIFKFRDFTLAERTEI